MPYLPSDAEKKSELYSNIINSDRLELSNKIEALKNNQNISGSIDANTPLRDDNGILVSFESDEAGIALEESFSDVRLHNTQRFYNKKVENEFTFFIPQTESDDSEETTEEVSDEEVEFQMTNRDFLIQFINELNSEEFDPNMSTKLLHSKILEFFRGERSRTQGQNADGWESFRLNPSREVSNPFPRKRYFEMKKDLKKFRYDDVIENHLYRTRKGQEIWLKLGFPYVQDI
tara:strand:+ start:1178 stop:1873 length:696 start_codon:yes stop_codon:yes gene_type:complete